MELLMLGAIDHETAASPQRVALMGLVLVPETVVIGRRWKLLDG